ncbi:MAG: TlpA disulfide reductase family protein [Gemmatimonadota bacterium]
MMLRHRTMVHAAAAIAILGGLAACRGDAQKTASAAGTESASPALAPPVVLALGQPVPKFVGTSLAGQPLRVGTAIDSVTLVNVWATWCTSCREEMQDLEAIHREFTPRGVRVVAVSVDAGSETLVRRFVERERLTFPVVHDQAGEFQRRFGVNGVPTTLVITKGGQLAWQQVGGVHGDPSAVRAALESALDR